MYCHITCLGIIAFCRADSVSSLLCSAASLSEGTMMDHYTSSYTTFQYHSDCQCLHKTAMASCRGKATNRRYLLLGALPGADSQQGALGAYQNKMSHVGIKSCLMFVTLSCPCCKKQGQDLKGSLNT